MDRQTLIDMAALQLRDARENRRWAIYYRLTGADAKADAFRDRARCCLRCARLFMQDAHTEERDVLHLECKP